MDVYYYILIWIVFTFTNFVVQFFKAKPDYEFAWTISYFQAAPIVCFYIISLRS